MTRVDPVEDEPRPPWARPGEPLGDANQFGLRVASVQLIGGHHLALPGPGVTAVVGANNSGKSTLLRQLHQELMNPGSTAGEPVQLVTGVQIAREGRESTSSPG